MYMDRGDLIQKTIKTMFNKHAETSFYLSF